MNDTTLDRTALRRLIVSHDRWEAFRLEHGLDISTMTMAQLRSAADALGVREAGNDASTVTTDTAPKNLFGEPVQSSTVKDKAKAAIGLMAAIEAIAGQSMDKEAIAALVRSELKAAMADTPSTSIEPESGVTRPRIDFIIVVLPLCT